MAEIAKRLDRTRFVRIHRSLIVNTERIRSVQSASHSEYLVTLPAAFSCAPEGPTGKRCSG